MNNLCSSHFFPPPPPPTHEGVGNLHLVFGILKEMSHPQCTTSVEMPPPQKVQLSIVKIEEY